ncbi:hypothetical protein [Burkholderia sp. TSV86]|uniref:hypothetical protein n=1 Tax=Burkholderia sp. TSV86 TaxID=1385594 RepID=UPI0012E3D180|nr:hypothetical protein [Burkholderia sp. TSV86]
MADETGMALSPTAADAFARVSALRVKPSATAPKPACGGRTKTASIATATPQQTKKISNATLNASSQDESSPYICAPMSAHQRT